MDFNRLMASALICGNVLLVAGCSTTQEAASEKIFYPPPPSPARVQYLTSFSEERDLVPPMSAFKKFVLGDDERKSGIVKPYGLAVQGTKLYVCDTIIAQVHILDLEARTWEDFRPDKSPGKLSKPIDIAVDSDGIRYISDTVLGKVMIYSADGTYKASIGGDGSMKPVGVAVSGNRIVIGDLKQRQVQVYDRDSLQLLFSFPRDPENEAEQLFSPTNIDVDQAGNIYVSDTGAFRVQKYDAEGNYLNTYGGQGEASGLFVRNKGIAVDHDAILYVSDAATQTIQMFNSEGSLLLYFGEPEGSSVPLVLPAGVAIDYKNVGLFQPYADKNFKMDYLLFVANQYGPRKISVYGFGSMIQP